MTNPLASIRGPFERLGAGSDVEAVEVGAQRVVVEGRPLAPHVGQPDGNTAGVAQPRLEPLTVRTRAGRTPQELTGPVHEERAGVARPADEEALRRGVRVADEPGCHEPLFADRPHDEGRSEDHQHVARLGRTGHDLVAQRVDCAAGDHGVALWHRPGRLPHRHHHRHLLLGDTEGGEELGVPATVGVQRAQRRSDTGVDCGQIPERIRRHCLTRPVAAGVGHGHRRPAQETLGVGHRPGQQEVVERGLGAPPFPVAVEETRQHRDALGVHRCQRWDHRRHGDARQRATFVAQPGGHLVERLAWSVPPCPLGVVTQDVGLGGIDAVGHPAPGDDGPVLVDGECLDRRRADVDADGDGN